MKAFTIKSSGNLSLGKLRSYNTATSHQVDLFYQWPNGARSSESRMLPDGRAYGFTSFNDEATGSSVVDQLYVTTPSESAPSDIQVFTPDSWLPGYMAVWWTFDWGLILSTRTGQFIVLKIDESGVPKVNLQSMGGFDDSQDFGVVSFADHSVRFISFDAQNMTFSVSTELGAPGPVDIAGVFPLSIPTTQTPADGEDITPWLAVGAATCGRCMAAMSGFGQATSMTSWMAANDSAGPFAQVYAYGLVGGLKEDGSTEYADSDISQFFCMNVDRQGNYQVAYQGSPGTPVADPQDSRERYRISQVLIDAVIVVPPFWHRHVRTFETIE